MALWNACNRVVNRVSNDTFAVDSVLYHPYGKEPFEIRCPYWSEYFQADPDGNISIKSNNPRIPVLLCDLRGNTPTNRDLWTIAGEVWGVEEVDPNNGEGNAWIMLRKRRLH